MVYHWGRLGIAVLPQLTIGPSFEVGGLARLGSWYDTREHQGAFLLAPGARVQMFLPIQDNKELTLHHDARAPSSSSGAYAHPSHMDSPLDCPSGKVTP